MLFCNMNGNVCVCECVYEFIYNTAFVIRSFSNLLVLHSPVRKKDMPFLWKEPISANRIHFLPLVMREARRPLGGHGQNL